MDIFSKEKRHEIMSKVRSHNTKPEEMVRKFLFSKGFRYRKNDKRYAGTPDIVLPKYHTVIFVNGCFWHQHRGCKSSKMPAENHDYWEKKLSHNILRDKENIKELANDGWHVIVIWECEISSRTKREARLLELENEIKASLQP